MPFRVHYEIFDNKHNAPSFQTYDYTMARIEWNDRKRNPKGLMWHLEQTVMPDGVLTKPEEYLFLVYRVRKLTIQYRSGGYKDEDKFVLSEHVRKLDKWNKRTRQFLDTHMKVMDADTTKRIAFFTLVEAWRNTYHERQSYSKQPGYEKAVYVQMTRKIRELEAEIDKYIKETIKLI